MMAITAKNIVQHEIIGLEAEVSKANNKSLQGVKGKIIDETQNTITIQESNGKTKKILKSQITLTLHIDNQTVEIEGESLISRPEDRTKK